MLLKKIINIFQFPFFFLYVKPTTADTADSIPFVGIVKGAFFNLLPKVVSYESIVPVFFEVSLPQIPEPLPKTNCEGEADICKLILHYRSMYDSTLRQLKDHPYVRKVQAVGRRRRDYPDDGYVPLGGFWKGLYGVASNEDIRALHEREDYISNRQDEIKKNVIENHHFLTNLTRNIQVLQANLTAVYDDRFEDIRQRIIKTTNSNYHTEALMMDVLGTSLKTEYMSSIITLMNGVGTDCRNKLIPRVVVNDAELDAQVQALNARLHLQKRETALKAEDLWKLEIADCVFTGDKVLITVHIPIRRKSVQWEILEVIRVAYQFDGYQCMINDNTQYVGKFGTEIIPISQRMSKFCRPEDDQLCLIPQHISDDSNFLTCAKALLEEIPVDIRQECSFVCHKSTGTVVNAIGNGQLAISNAKKIKFDCKNATNSKTYSIDHNIGAILLRVPCFCNVTVDGNRKLNPPFPCLKENLVDDQKVVQVIPSHFSNIRDIVFDDEIADFKNISEIINWKWNFATPIVNISTPTPLHWSAQYMNSRLWNDAESSSGLIYIWLVCLTVATVYMGGQTFFCKGSSSFSPLKMMMLLTLLPYVCCEETGPDLPSLSFTSGLLKLLKAFEISSIIFAIVGTAVGVWIIVVVYRVHKLCSCMYRIMKNNLES